MPMQTSKSALAGKINASTQQSVEEFKNEETMPGSGGLELPAGIEGGVARVTSCKFGVYETGDMKGEYYFLARASVVLPKEHAGIKVEGLATQIGPEPICDTPKRSRQSQAEHLQWVYAQIRGMGVGTKNIGVNDLESTAAAITEAGPHIRFRTWKPDDQKLTQNGKNWIVTQGAKTLGTYPTEQAAKTAYPYAGTVGRVLHIWTGPAQYNGEGQVDEVQDNTGSTETGSGDANPPFGDDLDMLVNKCDEGDADAQNTLIERAEAAGVAEEARNAPSWQEGADIIRSAEQSTASEGADAVSTDETPSDETTEPGKGEIWMWKSPKDKKETAAQFNKRKPIEVEVTKVDKGKKLATIKNLTTNKVLKDQVSFDDLAPVEE